MMHPPRQMVARSHRGHVPAVLVAAFHDLVEALGVGDHLGGVQGGADVVHEGVRVVDGWRVAGLLEDLAGRLPLLDVARTLTGRRSPRRCR